MSPRQGASQMFIFKLYEKFSTCLKPVRERESHLWTYGISGFLMGKLLMSVFDKLPIATNI